MIAYIYMLAAQTAATDAGAITFGEVLIASLAPLALLIGAIFTFRAAIGANKTREREVETNQSKANFDEMKDISTGWREYGEAQRDRLDKQEAKIETLVGRLDSQDNRIRGLEGTLHVAATHIADVHDWAAQRQIQGLPAIPALIVPLVQGAQASRLIAAQTQDGQIVYVEAIPTNPEGITSSTDTKDAL